MFRMTLGLVLACSGFAVADSTEAPAFEEMLKIDFHAHVFDDIPELAPMLERTYSRIINICNYYDDMPEMFVPAEKQAEMLKAKYAPYINFCSSFDPTKTAEPDFAASAVTWLDDSYTAGALMTKLWKNVGMSITTANGQYLLPDDPALDPIYDHMAKMEKPLLVHCADPIDAWRPLSKKSMHYAYYSNNPEWHLYGKKGRPHHDELMASRDNIMAKHPDLVLVAAHLGSLEHDLDALALRLDFFPNMYTDLAARIYILRAMPNDIVRDFFIKYQDRILYATDIDKYTPGGPSQQEREEFVANTENVYRRDYEYFTQTLNLPREVLEKIYHTNAQKIIPALNEQSEAN